MAASQHGATSLAIVPFSLSSPYGDQIAAPRRVLPLLGRSYTITQHHSYDGRGGTDLGFGASVYNSAIVLAHFLASAVLPAMPGAGLIELGAGLGLASIVAVATGFRFAVCTDGDDAVVRYAAANAEANGIIPANVSGLGADLGMPGTLPLLSCQRLRWGDDTDIGAAVSSAHLLARRHPTPTSAAGVTGLSPRCGGCGRADPFVARVIAGADVAAVPYAPALAALADTVLRLLLCCHYCGHRLSPAVQFPAANDGAAAVSVQVAAKSSASADEGLPVGLVPGSLPCGLEWHPLLRAAAAPATGWPVFVLGYQRRHVSEDAFFARLAGAGLARARVSPGNLHPDFRSEATVPPAPALYVFTALASTPAAALPVNDLCSCSGVLLRVGASRIPHAGHGLFARQAVPRGAVVCEYAADGRATLSYAEAARLPAHEKLYLMRLARGIFCVSSAACPGRFINDPTNRAPNCAFEKRPSEGLALVVALMDIADGDELYCSYGKGYWMSSARRREAAPCSSPGTVASGIE